VVEAPGTLSVLMPVYDEAATVEQAIAEVLAAELPVEVELVVVDDGSTDGTAEILDRGDWGPRVKVVHHPANRGKGAAVRTALEQATGEYAAIFDADLEYDPRDIGELLGPLLRGETNAVFGVRAFNGYTSHSYLYVLGNRAVTFACNVLFNVYIADMMTCHKVVRTEVFRALPLRASGFTIEPEITARLLQSGERIYEMPAHYRARSHSAGKKLTTADGFRVLGTLARCRFGPRPPGLAAPDAGAPLPPHGR